jgi:DNA-binding NarL/FixJ family response regulator
MYDKPVVLIEADQARPPTASEVLHELGLARNVLRFHDAGQALDRFKRERVPDPAVIVLDGLSSGEADLDALRAVKSDETLKSVPVIVLAPSGDPQVVDESFSLGAAGFVVKSASRGEFVEAIRAVHEYWTLSEVPSGVQSARSWPGS